MKEVEQMDILYGYWLAAMQNNLSQFTILGVYSIHQ